MSDVNPGAELLAMQERQKKNERELVAWNEWKTVCKIFKCSEENREALISRMWTSSRKKLETLLSYGNATWEKEYSAEEWGDEIGRAFDGYIHEGEENSKRLNYKDVIWAIIAEGKNDPLKAIRGKLTSQHSVLDNVLERFVVTQGLVVGVDNKHHSLVFSDRLNQKTGEGENAVEKGDLMAPDPIFIDPKSYPGIPRDVRTDWHRRFSEMFTLQESMILLAYFKRVAFTEAAVVEATGVKNSRASEILNGKFKGKEQIQEGLLDKLACLHEEFRSLSYDYGQVAVKDMVVDIFKKIAGTEKHAARLLSQIEENEKVENEKRMKKITKDFEND